MSTHSTHEPPFKTHPLLLHKHKFPLISLDPHPSFVQYSFIVFPFFALAEMTQHLGAYSDECENCVMSGPLSKAGRTFASRWYTRHYILKPDCLAYYKAMNVCPSSSTHTHTHTYAQVFFSSNTVFFFFCWEK
jgi:hypothetical protein